MEKNSDGGGDNNNNNNNFELALKFLSNPKVFGLPDDRKVDFLVGKGIDRATIERALLASRERTRYCPFNKKYFPEGTTVPGGNNGGFLSFLWRLIRLTSGLALGAYLIKKFVWPRLSDYLVDLGYFHRGSNRLTSCSSDRRRVSAPPDGQPLNREVLVRLDGIVATLQDVVARQQAVSESLALLLKTRQQQQVDSQSSEANVTSVGDLQQSNERMLQELADLKAMLVSPNRFPPMPSGSYVPSSGCPFSKPSLGASAAKQQSMGKKSSSSNSSSHQTQKQQPTSNSEENSKIATVETAISASGDNNSNVVSAA